MLERPLTGGNSTQGPPVSVLIPVFNTPPDQLSICLQSIYTQTHKADEIVIVDDASTNPETIAFMRELKVQNLRVIYLDSNHGIAGALNRGLGEVRNELVARMDSDDIMLPTRLGVQVQYMTDNPPVDVLSGALFYCRESAGVVSFDPNPVIHPSIVTKEIAKTSRWFINHPAVMFKRSKVMSVGGYDSKLRGYPEDYDLWVRMINAGCVLHNLSEPLIYLRLSNGSLTQKFNPGLDVFFSTRQASIALTGPSPMQAVAQLEPIPFSPIDLLSPLRFDVVVKYLYARSLINNYSTQYFQDLYKEHLRVWNGFFEVNNPTKNTFEAFDNDFKNIIASLQTVGFNSETSLIPLSDGNCMINGAHRVAAALALNIDVYCRPSFDALEGQKDCSWETVFRKAGFPDDMASRVALEYAVLKNKTRIVTIFPSASHDLEYSLNILRKYGRLFYYKSISLSENGPFNLMRQLYPDEPWAGNASNAYAGYREKERLCFTKSGPVVAVLVEFDDPSIGIEVKRRIREHFGVGNHSVHINDHHHETIRLAQTLFNENSIHFLNKSNLSALPVYDRLIARFRGGLDLNGMKPEHFCVTGSAILSSYGIRDCADLDYIHHGTMILNDPENLIHSHNNYGLKYYEMPYDDIVFNPSNHFYSNGLKHVSLDVLRNLKIRRNEEKDLNDLILLDSILLPLDVTDQEPLPLQSDATLHTSASIEENLNTYNWFNYSWFYDFLVEKDFRRIAEIGVWKGHSISYLANKLRSRDRVELFAVDLFENTYKYAPEDTSANPLLRKQIELIYEIYTENLKRTNTRHLIKDLKGVSWEVAQQFANNSLDAAYIDADHSYESVKKDILAWFPKVRPGGILSGHDYVPGNSVAQAVDELERSLFNPRGLNLIRERDSVWYVAL
jgi:glycosyltransferase involved in cell wall biosynthesis/predicted O-methyltransferase YrrM